MNILFVAATPFEIAPLADHLKEKYIPFAPDQYQRGDIQVETFVTGVGLPATIFQLTRKCSSSDYDLIINAGIAGSFDRKLELGSVVQVRRERFADLGVEEADGSFTDLFELQLVDPDAPPFKDGWLVNEAAGAFAFLPAVDGISVHKVHGTDETARQVFRKYKAGMESMEGAGVFYVCLQLGIPFFEIRSVSNYVEQRQRDKWNIPLAIEQLNKVLIELLSSLS